MFSKMLFSKNKLQIASSVKQGQQTEGHPERPKHSLSQVFCSGGEFLSVIECFQWDRVPSILPMRTKSQGNEVILSTYYHSNLIRTTPLLIEFLLTTNQLS